MVKKKRKYKKKTPRKKLEFKLNSFWSEIIRSKGSCEHCGSRSYLNAHHHYGKRAASVKWDLDNGICLCPGCHTFSSVFSAHQTPAIFVRWINKKRGRDWEERLRKRHSKIVKYTISQLQDLLIELEREYEIRKKKVL